MIVMENAKAEKRGRGRPRNFDQDAALEKAMKLFWERGYEATSMSDLTAEMGLNPSSLYAFYGGKEKLFQAALERFVSQEGATMPALFDSAPTAREALQGLFVEVARRLTLPGRPRGCMVALGNTQCSPAAESVRRALQQKRAESLQVMKDRIRRAVVEKELPQDTEVEALARFYSTVLQGMSVQARDGASREDLLKIGQAAMRAWPESRDQGRLS